MQFEALNAKEFGQNWVVWDEAPDGAFRPGAGGSPHHANGL